MSRSEAQFAQTRTSGPTPSGDVSVVILNLGKAALTIRCVETLLRHGGATVETIVVDNTPDGAADATRLRAALPEHVAILALGVNRYFGEANMIGAEAARGRTLVFLNNDAFVTPGWLVPLLAALENPGVGAAVPRFAGSDGRVIEVGSAIAPDGRVLPLDEAGPGGKLAPGEPRVVPFGSAACLAIRRDVFFRAGGFALRYEPAYYEDADLCLRLAAQGLQVLCVPESTVIHLENRTSLTPGVFGRSSLQMVTEVNCQKFLAVWGASLRGDPSASPTARVPMVAETRSAAERRPSAGSGFFARRRAGPAGVELPEPVVVDSRTRYQLAVAAALAREREVVLLTRHPVSRSRIASLCAAMGIDPPAFDLALLSDERRRDRDLALFVGTGGVSPPGSVPARRWIEVAHGGRRWTGTPDLVVTLGERAAARLSAERSAPIPPVEVAPPAIVPPAAPPRRREAGAMLKIVAAGRFGTDTAGQRFDACVEAARVLAEDGLAFRLTLLGAVPPDDAARERFLAILRRAEGLPVELLPDLPRPAFLQRLAVDMVWHAPGDENGGIAVAALEAAALGARPVVLAPEPLEGPLGAAERVGDFLGLAEAARRQARAGAAEQTPLPGLDEAAFAQRWRGLAARVGA